MARGRSASAFFLTAALATLGYANWMAATSAIETAPIAVAANASDPDVARLDDRPATAPALAQLNETLARPLFSATRRPKILEQVSAADPVIAPPPAKTETVQPPAKLRLLGTMRIGTAAQRALIEREGQAESSTRARWVAVGGDVDGWRVTAIGRDSVEVETAGERTTLKLYPAKRTAAAE